MTEIWVWMCDECFKERLKRSPEPAEKNACPIPMECSVCGEKKLATQVNP